jgi:type II secretory pathway component PulF
VAELTANPKDLITLWEEYQNGVGHRKAAQLFMPSERAGRAHIKHKYHHRKIVWDILSLLVNANVHFEEACEHVYAAYPGKSLTAITSSITKKTRKTTPCQQV